MAHGTPDSQVGARICNGLGIMRACLETQKLEQFEGRTVTPLCDRGAGPIEPRGMGEEIFPASAGRDEVRFAHQAMKVGFEQ